MGRRCIAIIGDIVESRQIKGSRREELQSRFRTVMERLNRDLHHHKLADFVITTGDEFQGLLSAAGSLPEIVWTTERILHPQQVRLAIGHGTLETALSPTAISMDGPVWHRAREGLEAAKDHARLGGVFRGFGNDEDEILSGVATLLEALRRRFTDRQREVVRWLREAHTHEEVARELGISRQAVTKHSAAADWEAYQTGENAWRRMLARYDYTSLWGRP